MTPFRNHLSNQWESRINYPISFADSFSPPPLLPDVGLNSTFVKEDQHNQVMNATFEVNNLEDDRLSNAESEGSQSNRLNNVGDVQHIAKMQEESKGKFGYR